MKRQILTLCAALAALFPATAHADLLSSTLGERVTEASHAVTLTFEEGIARYVVRRTFRNVGSRHDEAVLGIELPYGAAATNLRIRVGERWYDGELMEAGRAADLYRELTGLGPHAPRDPALLSWRWADQLDLRVFPVPPAGTATVEYTLTLPTEYSDGRYIVTYPLPEADSTNLADPVLTVDWSGSEVLLGRDPIPTRQPVVLRAAPLDTHCETLDLPRNCVTSSVRTDAPTSGPVSVDFEIRHTYRSDLRVVLVAPSGQRFDLWANDGGSENDIKLSRTLEAAPAPAGVWRMAVVDDAGMDVGFLVSWSLAFAKRTREGEGTPIAIPDSDSDGASATITLNGGIEELNGRLGRVALKGAHASRFELDVPAQLSAVPERPHVVFVVDTSISVSEGGLANQKALIDAFLAHVPDARVEVVTYNRRATRLFGTFHGVDSVSSHWTDSVKKGRLALQNGSNLDEGLRLAYESLPDDGPRYVVALTDDRLRPTWREPAAAPAAFSRGAVAHVVVLERGGDALDRDDEHRLSAVANSTGGILVGAPDIKTMDDKQLNADALHLVRPTRLEFVDVEGIADVPTTLPEGSAVREMSMERGPRTVRIRGRLWTRPIELRVRASEAFSRATAAWVFSGDHHDELTDSQMMAFAMYGRAVSPVTSYLAIEPGVRPSVVGLEHAGFGRGAGGLGRRQVVRAVVRPQDPPSLAALLGPAVRTCSAAHGAEKLELRLDTTLTELVDVTASTTTAFSSCVAEAAWALRLPSAFGFHATWSEVVALN